MNKNPRHLPFRRLTLIFGLAGSLCALSPSSASATSTLVIDTMSLPGGTVGVSYSAQLYACLFTSGGSGNQCPDATSASTWTLAGGSYSLPAGLSISSSGAISGTPTNPATYSFTVVATDGLNTAQQNFSITIASPATTACASPSGTCWYVSTTGSDSNNGISRSTPFRTIQKAANSVNPGDWVIVLPGVYSNSSLVGEGTRLVQMARGGTSSAWVTFLSDTKWGAVLDGLVDVSQSNCSPTVVDPSSCGTGEAFEFSSTNNCTNSSTDACYIRVQGFEITRFREVAFSNYENGQYIDIAQNHLHDMGRYCADTSTGRGAIFLGGSNVTIEQNLIHDIGRLAPGEFGCNPSTTHFQNLDHGVYLGENNQSSPVAPSNVTIQNNIFYNIKHGWGVHIYNGYSSVPNNVNVFNNTFAFANPWRSGQIIVAVQATNLLIENNIFYNPLNAGIYLDPPFSNSTITIENNITYSSTNQSIYTAISYNGSTTVDDPGPSAGVISSYSSDKENVDPMLFSPSTFDFRLLRNSPAIDSGLTISGLINDYEGVARPQPAGSSYDMGAYEFHTPF